VLNECHGIRRVGISLQYGSNHAIVAYKGNLVSQKSVFESVDFITANDGQSQWRDFARISRRLMVPFYHHSRFGIDVDIQRR